MSNFMRVCQNVTRVCSAFNSHQKAVRLVNSLQPHLSCTGQARFLCRNVTCSKSVDCKAVVSFPEVLALPTEYYLNQEWSNMKVKPDKGTGKSKVKAKKDKHKHKKKKSKYKSKTKATFAMATAAANLKEGGSSSSDSEVLIVFEAQKVPPKLKRAPVQEIILDEDSCSSTGSSVELLDLQDIALPGERTDSLDISSIPLPSETNHVLTKFQAVSVSCASEIPQRERESTVEGKLTAHAPGGESLHHLYNCDSEETDGIDSFATLRKWERTSYGNALESSGGTSEGTVFTVMSYNVLAQQLLEDHMSLYTYHDVRFLSWEHRSRTLMKEFRSANADVLCLQEVQHDHLEWFNNQLSDLGYQGLFKRRTHGLIDGCAIYFKRDRFRLLEYSSVEYYQPGIQVLDRDNVGLIARLEAVGSRGKQIVVATTHLLFNPRRHDVKLAQMQMLLAELERISYLKFDEHSGSPIYRPVIITGDLNLQPHSAVYRFLTDGFIDYSVLAARTLQPAYYGYVQEKLIPPDLFVSNTCQHIGIVQNRRSRRRDTEEDLLDELRLLKPYNSDNDAYLKEFDSRTSTRPFQELVRLDRPDGCYGNFASSIHRSNETGTCSSGLSPEAGTSTSGLSPRLDNGLEPGMLSHCFHLKSVYKHSKKDPTTSKYAREATTHQQAWVTVDYILYSGRWNRANQTTVEGSLKLISRYGLPTDDQCRRYLKCIPNLACGSDHLPLLARFLLRY